MNIRVGHIVALGMALLVAGLNLIWLSIDQQPTPLNDPYLEKIYNLANGYSEKALSEIIRLWYWASIGPRTPLYSVLGSVLVVIFGPSPDPILLINSAALVLAAIFTYALGIRLMPPLWAVFAVLVLLCFPLTIELSRLARPHSVVVGFSAFALWCSVRCIEAPSISRAWVLMLAVLMAFLMHPAVAYALLPVLLSIPILMINRLRTQGSNLADAIMSFFKSQVLVKGFLPAFGLAAFFVGIWVYVKWEQYLGMRHVLDTIFVKMAGPWGLEVTMPETLNWANTLALLAAPFLFVKALRQKIEPTACLYFVWLLLMFASIHFLYRSLYWHNFTGSTPLIALIIVKGLHYSQRWLPIFAHRLFVALVLVGALQSYLSSGWGVAEIKGLPCGSHNRYCDQQMPVRSNRPLSEPWPIEQLLTPLFESKENLREFQFVSLLSFRREYFSDEMLEHNMIRYFDQPSRLPSNDFYVKRNTTIQRIGRGEGGFANWMNAQFVIYLDKQNSIPPSAQAKLKPQEARIISYLKADLDSSSPHFELLRNLHLPNGEVAVLLRRKKELENQASLRKKLGLND